ncbi:TPA: hypothetical protein NJ048_004359 [Vibrio parahaemolyticus]|nr:hypothetical protein [Vibrio parahaemolyticus]
MKAYVITYDLRTPNQNYNGLYEAIKTTGRWWHYLDSTWIIATDESPAQIWSRLEPFVDNNDNLLIMEVKNNSQGWLPQDAWEWINENVPTY